MFRKVIIIIFGKLILWKRCVCVGARAVSRDAWIPFCGIHMALVKKKKKKKRPTTNTNKKPWRARFRPLPIIRRSFYLFIIFFFIFDPLKRIVRGRSLGWDNIDGPVDWKNIPVQCEKGKAGKAPHRRMYNRVFSYYTKHTRAFTLVNIVNTR